MIPGNAIFVKSLGFDEEKEWMSYLFVEYPETNIAP